MRKSKENKNLKPYIIISALAVLTSLTIAGTAIATVRSANKAYALTNQRLINILNTQNQQSGEIKLNVKNKNNKQLDHRFIIVNPHIAQFSNHYFKLDPDLYYTPNYVYYASPKTEKYPDRNWGREKINDRDDLHLQYQRILMNAVTGLNSEQMLNHKKIVKNDIKFASEIKPSSALLNALKNKPVVARFRNANVHIKNNRELRLISKGLLADILGSSYALNFTLAPNTIKIKNATADLTFKQDFKAENYAASNPISAPVKDLAITYHFTAQFPNQAGKTVIRKINITVQRLGRHKNMAVPKRVIDSAKKTDKKYAKQKQN